jgi:tetraacyldisaccharide 4'-kinase
MNLPLPIRILLWPFSLIYGLAVWIRGTLYAKGVLRKKRLKVPVISVGNLTVGGTGKTPMVMWLAEYFLNEGKRVAILSRGYRGEGGTSDEIELLKRRLGGRVQFGIGADRYEQGSRIENENPVDLFLLDDGFQHIQLEREANILMLDGSRKLANEWLLPAGSLREPISACRRANLFVVTRKSERPDLRAADSKAHAIFYAETRLLGFRKPESNEAPIHANELGAGPFFGFCGIGNPAAFFDDLLRWHVPMSGTMNFRDHHRYSAADIRKLEDAAQAAGAQALITTEKDDQNLAGLKFRMPLYVAVIDFVLSSESEFCAALERLLPNSQEVRN